MGTCTTSTLSPFIPDSQRPWDRKRVLHLYRRLGFGSPIENIDNQISKNPGVLVDELIDEAVNLPIWDVPEWADWGYSDYLQRGLQDRIFDDSIEYALGWVKKMLSNGFRERLMIFWLNHFVTEYETYFCSSTLYKYLDVLQKGCLGNFKDFVYNIGITPAMLVYLNGDENNKFEPNENYARELFELFTLGADQGYTQEDIVNAAKALTGWTVEDCNRSVSNPLLFDEGEKTIFDQTGNYGYDDLIDLIFDNRADQIAKFICRKIYVEFVSDDVDDVIVNDLAATFIQENFELIPVYRKLFKSDHFFDDINIGVKVKSPYHLLLGLLGEFGVTSIGDEEAGYVYYISDSIGMNLINPPDVAGWQGNRSWVDSSTLAVRWTLVDAFSGYLFENYNESYRDLAKKISNNSADVEFVLQSVVEYFLPNGFQKDQHYNSALAAFKAEVPENYFTDGTWNLDFSTVPYQMALLIQYLGRQPEYQLY